MVAMILHICSSSLETNHFRLGQKISTNLSTFTFPTYMTSNRLSRMSNTSEMEGLTRLLPRLGYFSHDTVWTRGTKSSSWQWQPPDHQNSFRSEKDLRRKLLLAKTQSHLWYFKKSAEGLRSTSIFHDYFPSKRLHGRDLHLILLFATQRIFV